MEENNSRESGNRVEGTVTSFDIGKGFGFISLKGSSKEVFVHQQAILGTRNRTLVVGDRVSFEVTESPKGPRAANVTKIWSDS